MNLLISLELEDNDMICGSLDSVVISNHAPSGRYEFNQTAP